MRISCARPVTPRPSLTLYSLTRNRFYANTVQIFFIAGCIGVYHFDKEKVSATLPFKFLKVCAEERTAPLLPHNAQPHPNSNRRWR